MDSNHSNFPKSIHDFYGNLIDNQLKPVFQEDATLQHGISLMELKMNQLIIIPVMDSVKNKEDQSELI